MLSTCIGDCGNQTFGVKLVAILLPLTNLAMELDDQLFLMTVEVSNKEASLVVNFELNRMLTQKLLPVSLRFRTACQLVEIDAPLIQFLNNVVARFSDHS